MTVTVEPEEFRFVAFDAPLIRTIGEDWPSARWKLDPEGLTGRPEPRLLKLSCDKALADLGWHAVLSFPETARMTSAWYRRHEESGAEGMYNFTAAQIHDYCDKATDRGLAWTQNG